MQNPEQMDFVLSKGITHVLNVQIGCDTQLWYFSDMRGKYPDVEFLHLYFSDDKQEKPSWIWNTILSFVNSVIPNLDNKVYVHCAMGESRSPAVVYLLLRTIWRLSDKEAKKKLTEDYFKPLKIEEKYHNYIEGIENYIKTRGGET